MGGNTILSNFVHFVGADLDFKGFIELCHNSCVQRLIVVCLGHCNIIFESAGDRLPKVVHFAKECIAILYRVCDNSHSKKVIDLVYINICFAQFFKD